MSNTNEKQTNLETGKKEQSNVVVTNAKQSPKKKVSKGLLWGIVIASLLFIGGVVWFYLDYTKNLKSFDGVGNIDDSMEISLENAQDILKRLQGAQAIGTTIDGGNVIEDIASLKTAFEANKDAFLASNDSVIAIPSVGVKFALASADLSSVELVKEYAKYYTQTDKSATILVEGYACNIGDEQSNMILSQNRANNIKAILIECGVPEANIEVKYYGESKYEILGYNTQEEHRRVNISIK